MKRTGRRPTLKGVALAGAVLLLLASACAKIVGVGEIDYVDAARDSGTDASDGGPDSSKSEDADARPGCAVGSQRCSDGGVQTCISPDDWSSPVACATGTCSGNGCTGSSATAPSCQGGGAGKARCGKTDDSCCTSFEVTGGTFHRTYVNPGKIPTSESDPATVSGLRLDEYLVTVGRFRSFVSAWDGGAGYVPEAGAGKHPHLNGGRGLADGADPGSYEPGWASSDDSNIAPTNTNLLFCTADSTWTPDAGAQEALPINCIDWAEAYAFCIWDGGFLPSEAEWEYAAAGGADEREFPWGKTPPGASNQYAIYGDGVGNCYYPSGMLEPCSGAANIAPVGTTSMGGGLWGQLDMGGEVAEWVLDWYASPYVDPWTNCASLSPTGTRVTRSGNFTDNASTLLPPLRGSLPPAQRGSRGVGVRCARAP
jgi:formylglycine-generating enzyme